MGWRGGGIAEMAGLNRRSEDKRNTKPGRTRKVARSGELAGLWHSIAMPLREGKKAVPKLEASQGFGGGENFLGVGEEGFLERRRVGHRRVERGDADKRAVEIVEGFFAEDGGDFAGDAAGFGVFVDDQALVGFP